MNMEYSASTMYAENNICNFEAMKEHLWIYTKIARQ